ncbi:MAG: dihydroneopterin aldolase [Saprospiraceae bacterium]|nr:dihydroneopterin aldolase [Saprospiraceae bacterium]
MTKLILNDMRFYAYHGYYEEEQVLGAYYTVNVEIEADFKNAANEDELAKTLNYETLYSLVKIEMKKRFKLIETLGYEILQSIKRFFPKIESITIVIEKEHPPLLGNVKAAKFVINENYTKKCSKCGKQLICYKDENCWCKSLTIRQETLKSISTQYKGCLCENCLTQYVG